jgi:hypothetical protein
MDSIRLKLVFPGIKNQGLFFKILNNGRINFFFSGISRGGLSDKIKKWRVMVFS